MTAQKPRLKKPVEKVREELLSDPDTKRIAKAVGMELEEYVELVLDYAQNPDKEPVLQVADDEELKAAGYTPPSVQEVAQFFLDGAAGKLGIEGPNFNKSGFESGGAAKPTQHGDQPGFESGGGNKPTKHGDQPGFENSSGSNGKPSLK